MVLSYLGINIRYSRLVNLLKIQPDIGGSIYNLKHLTSLGVTVDLQDGYMDLLQSHIVAGNPVIVGLYTMDLPDWNENVDHAVVVVGMNDLSVFYHDPWFVEAPKSVDRRKFESAWLYHEYVYALIQKP